MKKAVLLIRANPTSMVEEVLNYQENILRKYLEDKEVSICGIYKFIGHELDYQTFEMDSLLLKIKTKKIQQIYVLSTEIISSNPSIIFDFRCFCNYHKVSLIPVYPLLLLLEEINSPAR